MSEVGFKVPTPEQIREFHAALLRGSPDLPADQVQNLIRSPREFRHFLAQLGSLVTPTTYGPKIEAVFYKDAILLADGAGDEEFDVKRLQLFQLLPYVNVEKGVPCGAGIVLKEAAKKVRADHEGVRAWLINWGQRAAERIWAARDSIPESVWPIGAEAYFFKTVWRDQLGHARIIRIGRTTAPGGPWFYGNSGMEDRVYSGYMPTQTRS
jgi:hypothetical protein